MKNTQKKKVYFLTQHWDDLPPDEHWLTRQEATVLATYEFPKRRRNWMLGRWTAKTALTRMIPDADRPMAFWRIDADTDGAPMILGDGQRTSLSISLSHSRDRAVSVLAESPMRLGCDLEWIEARSRSFEETFFTDSERAMLDRNPESERARLVTLIWSAKESALKALRTGLKADTRRVRIISCSDMQSGAWNSLAIEDRLEGGEFRGWWRLLGGMVMTVVSDKPIAQPVEL